MTTYTITSIIEGEKRRSVVDANSKEEAIKNLEKHLEMYNLYIEELISIKKERKYNKPVVETGNAW